MAAAYLYHIVKNHPFADGNKRTGTYAAFVFLDMNGYELDPPTEEAEQLVLAVAQGKATKADVARFFRQCIKE